MTVLYVSDLDGTLLRNDATLSPFARQVLSELLQQGLLFTVASARSVISMHSMLAGLKLHLPVIEFNGAFISDLESGQHQVINHLAPTVVETAYQLIGYFGCTPFISTFNGVEDCLYYCDIANAGMQWYLNDRRQHSDRRLRALANLTHAFHDQVVCLTVIDSSDRLGELAGTIEERLAPSVETHLIENAYSPGWYWLTIHDRRATKDQAIHRLRQEWGLADAELVVFGDNHNDIKMFQAADRAVAVNNATAEAKRHATHLIGSNQEDSVACFIRDDWSNQLEHANMENPLA